MQTPTPQPTGTFDATVGTMSLTISDLASADGDPLTYGGAPMRLSNDLERWHGTRPPLVHCWCDGDRGHQVKTAGLNIATTRWVRLGLRTPAKR